MPRRRWRSAISGRFVRARGADPATTVAELASEPVQLGPAQRLVAIDEDLLGEITDDDQSLMIWEEGPLRHIVRRPA